ncbi:unnamed protein product [Arctia plantaginis]|uniref:SHSP domain-containing protein n=1 Tax=Arctia plantaginis TaxID=874455 RepID=A0A8S0ZS98_ARCPL|nr:unnamed protein product [Arctia plantaginis]
MEFASVCPVRWLPDHNFAMCMTPYDVFQDIQSCYYRPWQRYNQTTSKVFSSTVENEKGNYKITLDVQYFRPNEINVKVANHEIIVEGKHEERQDIYGFVTRQFKRRYSLPTHCLPENVTSTLSSDGVLTIIAEKKLSISQDVPKIIPIELSGIFPRKTQIETKITSELTQKALKQERKKEKEETREEHSRLIRPELLKEIFLETNDTCLKTETKQSIDNMKESEKMNQLNISRNLNKIEESVGNSIVGLTALKEQFGQNSSIINTEMEGIKYASEISSIKSASETSYPKSPPAISGIQSDTDLSDVESILVMCDKKSTSEGSGTKKVSQVSEMQTVSDISEAQTVQETLGTKSVSQQSDMKKPSGMSGIKGVLEMTELKIGASETCGVRGMSKTLVEESASSCTSSSSMLSSMTVSGNAGECIISEKLREVAENI